MSTRDESEKYVQGLPSTSKSRSVAQLMDLSLISHMEMCVEKNQFKYQNLENDEIFDSSEEAQIQDTCVLTISAQAIYVSSRNMTTLRY